MALGGLDRSAWKSTLLVLFGARNVLLNSWSSASWPPPSGGVQCSPNSNEPGENGCCCWPPPPPFIMIGGLSAGDGSANDVNIGLLAIVL